MLAKLVSLAAVRARLSAKGMTPRPVCPKCRRETEPRQWGTDACRECEAAVAFRDNRIQQIDRELALLWGAGREGADVQDACDALEIERADLLPPSLTDMLAERGLNPDGNPAFHVLPEPVVDRSPFLPEDDDD